MFSLVGVVAAALGAYLVVSAVLATGKADPPLENNLVPLTQESVAIGASLYQEDCALCHGESGRGDGPAARGMSPRPADLTTHVSLHPDGELQRFIRDGFPNTAMRPFRDQLTQEEIWNLVNYLRQTFPAK